MKEKFRNFLTVGKQSTFHDNVLICKYQIKLVCILKQQLNIIKTYSTAALILPQLNIYMDLKVLDENQGIHSAQTAPYHKNEQSLIYQLYSFGIVFQNSKNPLLHTHK